MNIEIIAEAAQGYEGNFNLTEMLLKAAAASNADAIKYQLVYADELCTPKYEYYNLFKSLELKDSEWSKIKKLSTKLKIDLQFDIFGSRSLRLCEKLKIKTIKLHPTDMTNQELLGQVAKSKILNVCLGIGGSELDEINSAIHQLKNKNIILMTGFQNYPTPTRSNQISRISYLKNKLKAKNIEFGFADHEVSQSIEKFLLPAIAVGSGVKYIEKHFTLSKTLNLEDSETALDPEEFRVFTAALKLSSASIGKTRNTNNFGMSKEEINYRNTIRRHVVSRSKIKKGKIINSKDLILKRSAGKKPIKDLNMVVGKKAKREIMANQPVTLRDLILND